jgi:uncharacterized protein YbbK (DUF523 family)
VKPRVGISRCLLGDDVRYDGTNKRSAASAALAAQVEWVPVCPEIEVGMGVPREPIQLVAHRDGIPSAGECVRLRGVDTGEDWTSRMDRWARERVAELAAQRISGFVLKARSPSCGPADVLVHSDAGDAMTTARGLFAEALATAMPGLPMVDEEALEEPRVREQFIQRVRAFADPKGPRRSP